MKRILLALLLTAGVCAAQDAQKTDNAPKATMVQRLFILKYADPNQLVGLLQVFNANIRQNSELHAIAVEASPEAIAAIEDAIHKLDVPSAAPKDVEMTAFLVAASDGATAPGSSTPKDLDPVITQLRNTFPFKSYGLLDVITFRTRTGQGVRTNSSGASIAVGNRQIPVTTSLNINSIALEGDGSTLRVDHLNAGFRVPQAIGAPGDNQYSITDLGLQTDLDIKEGQKVVVGRLGLSHDQALFLVMMGKIL